MPGSPFHRIFSPFSLLSVTHLRAFPPGQPLPGDFEINRPPSSIPGRWPDEKTDALGSWHELIAVAKGSQTLSHETLPANL
jgi:hypothetical protein